MRLFNLITVASFSLLIACGGGGGGSEPPVQTATPPPPIGLGGGTGDIVAPGGFDFATAREITVEIRADAFLDKRAFVTIYSEYQTNSVGERIPVYDTKLAMLPLENAVVDESIMVTNDIDKLFVRVNGDASVDIPLSEVLTIENNRISWQF